ncbi:MAG: NFYB/HAP3 family transcription factor subunit [Candidatus Marsarchaeota archaeon]|nr:NFYB/HAP3 family transcription factor subunit [Candidatus Marsarchaeota archaeon]MCL5419091.1 NFYB/HAP3 family transcription factor subunit [Candidatus Marsarchaeota archaeon]
MYISGSTIRKILKEAGASRTSSEAVETMQEYVNNVAYGVAQKAVRLSRHAKRKTVDTSDIKLAIS